MITFATELKNKVMYTKEEFLSEVKGMIEVAINEKGYSFQELTPGMIAEDITGPVEKNTIPEEGMAIIKEELTRFEKSSDIHGGYDQGASKIKAYLEKEIAMMKVELSNVPKGSSLNISLFLQVQTRLSTLNEILFQLTTDSNTK